jgi:ATP-dependent Lon protease
MPIWAIDKRWMYCSVEYDGYERPLGIIGIGKHHHFNRNYLDWLTSLPWEKTTEDKKDLEWAEYILEKDLHGMKDVKERILELIAAGMLEQQQRKGKILCLYGLPGVGKKSLAKSIAKAIGRKAGFIL